MRRLARLRRRQLRRRAARQRELFETLQHAGLLPRTIDGDPKNPSLARHALLERLDGQLVVVWRQRLEGLPAPEHVLPYALRGKALDFCLEPFELGRVLYHLSQRRGFKSNRREGRAATKKEQQERGRVDAGIETLRQEIAVSGARTLGAYLSRLDPSQTRIRARWTARNMYEAEFVAFTNAYARLKYLRKNAKTPVMLSGARPAFGRAESKHPYRTNEVWVL
jgi:CRISPR-associated endonuclease Csn1